MRISEDGEVLFPGEELPRPMSTPKAVRCRWRVLGGLLPGVADPIYTKFFELTSDEYAGGKNGLTRFLEVQAQANAYSLDLQIQCAVGRGVNWTEVDFLWY